MIDFSNVYLGIESAMPVYIDGATEPDPVADLQARVDARIAQLKKFTRRSVAQSFRHAREDILDQLTLWKRNV